MPGSEIAALVKREPTIGPIVSKLRYLTKISDKLAAHQRAKNDARREECLQDLRDIATDTPAPDA